MSGEDILARLRRLSAVQARQAEALAAGDVDALDALHLERVRLQAEAPRPRDAGLTGADLAEAEALVEALAAGQERLVAAARAVRDRLGAEIAELGRGRVAVAGYRPTPRTRAVLVDSRG